MANPLVFISYSHDSEDHKQWVLRLAIELRNYGVDAMLDQWDLSPGQDIARFMADGISSSARVLLVCSENYVAKANNGSGGVGYERLIVSAEVISATNTLKFIPVVRRNSKSNKLPVFLGARLYLDFEDDSQFRINCERLAQEIHGKRVTSKPALGSLTDPTTNASTTRYLRGSARRAQEVLFDLFGGRSPLLESGDNLTVFQVGEKISLLHTHIRDARVKVLEARVKIAMDDGLATVDDIDYLIEMFRNVQYSCIDLLHRWTQKLKATESEVASEEERDKRRFFKKYKPEVFLATKDFIAGVWKLVDMSMASFKSVREEIDKSITECEKLQRRLSNT